jgi:type IV secretory pathway VirB2 component (pilin)
MRFITRYQPFLRPARVVGAGILMPQLGFCSVESSLAAIQTKLITVILPLAAILGLVFAGLSFVAGSPNARAHLTLAIFGAAIGFGAPSIIAFIRGLVN